MQKKYIEQQKMTRKYLVQWPSVQKNPYGYRFVHYLDTV